MFTGLLLFYVTFLSIAFDLREGTFSAPKAAAMILLALLIAGAIARYTNKLLGKPLQYLQEGIASVRQGRLEPIQVSTTGDEIEFVGESFNAMIADLAASRNEILQYQEQLEERIRRRTRDLEEASRKALAASQAKSEFLANMSHELRTPMSGVLGMIDIVLDSDLDGSQREQLQTAKGCANSLLALLNDILDLSKIEAGKMVLEDVPFDVRVLVRECIKSMAPRAEQKGIAVRWSVDPGVPERIAADPLRLRQVLSNLLSNAVKFTDHGSVEVRLHSEWDTAGRGHELIIEVADTGVGIPHDKLDSIFEEFTQADGSISRKYGGTGLGLAITRRLVEMQHGSIAVSSVVGKGSTFRVRVPCAPVSEMPERPAQDPARELATLAPPKAPSATILVVEDNAINQKVVTAILKRHGYQVAVAGHGGQVLSALETHPISLILMDIQMPVIDGLEATRLIRRDPRWKHLPIIAMTARAMAGDRDLCLEAGMNAYVSKPVNRVQLIAVIEQHLLMAGPVARRQNGNHASRAMAGDPAEELATASLPGR